MLFETFYSRLRAIRFRDQGVKSYWNPPLPSEARGFRKTTGDPTMKNTFSLAKKTGAALLLGASLFLVACNGSDNDKEPMKPSLHARLGGTPAIASVVDTFLVEVLKDTVINR